MNNCDRTKSLINDCVDGLSSESEVSDVTIHTSQCQTCAGLFNELTALRQTLSTLPRREAPADFNDLLKARLAREASPDTRSITSMPARLMQRLIDTVTAPLSLTPSSAYSTVALITVTIVLSIIFFNNYYSNKDIMNMDKGLTTTQMDNYDDMAQQTSKPEISPESKSQESNQEENISREAGQTRSVPKERSPLKSAPARSAPSVQAWQAAPESKHEVITHQEPTLAETIAQPESAEESAPDGVDMIQPFSRSASRPAIPAKPAKKPAAITDEPVRIILLAKTEQGLNESNLEAGLTGRLAGQQPATRQLPHPSQPSFRGSARQEEPDIVSRLVAAAPATPGTLGDARLHSHVLQPVVPHSDPTLKERESRNRAFLETYLKVASLIEGAGGRITRKSDDLTSDLLTRSTIEAEIPVGSFNAFRDGVKDLTTLTESIPDIHNVSDKPVKLQIEIRIE